MLKGERRESEGEITGKWTRRAAVVGLAVSALRRDQARRVMFQPEPRQLAQGERRDNYFEGWLERRGREREHERELARSGSVQVFERIGRYKTTYSFWTEEGVDFTVRRRSVEVSQSLYPLRPNALTETKFVYGDFGVRSFMDVERTEIDVPIRIQEGICEGMAPNAWWVVGESMAKLARTDSWPKRETLQSVVGFALATGFVSWWREKKLAGDSYEAYIEAMPGLKMFGNGFLGDDFEPRQVTSRELGYINSVMQRKKVSQMPFSVTDSKGPSRRPSGPRPA
jgi:hypothetical protein